MRGWYGEGCAVATLAQIQYIRLLRGPKGCGPSPHCVASGGAFAVGTRVPFAVASGGRVCRRKGPYVGRSACEHALASANAYTEATKASGVHEYLKFAPGNARRLGHTRGRLGAPTPWRGPTGPPRGYASQVIIVGLGPEIATCGKGAVPKMARSAANLDSWIRRYLRRELTNTLRNPGSTYPYQSVSSRSSVPQGRVLAGSARSHYLRRCHFTKIGRQPGFSWTGNDVGSTTIQVQPALSHPLQTNTFATERAGPR